MFAGNLRVVNENTILLIGKQAQNYKCEIITNRPYMRIGFKHLSQQCIMGLDTFSPIKLTGRLQSKRNIGSGWPRVSVVKVGACNWEMSVSKSTRRNNKN